MVSYLNRNVLNISMNSIVPIQIYKVIVHNTQKLNSYVRTDLLKTKIWQYSNKGFEVGYTYVPDTNHWYVTAQYNGAPASEITDLLPYIRHFNEWFQTFYREHRDPTFISWKESLPKGSSISYFVTFDSVYMAIDTQDKILLMEVRELYNESQYYK